MQSRKLLRLRWMIVMSACITLFAIPPAHAQNDGGSNAASLAKSIAKLMNMRVPPQDTTYVRQYAKDAPQLLVIYSGVQSKQLAENIRDAVFANPLCHNKPPEHVRLLSLEEAANADMNERSHHLFLISGNELKQDLPDALKAQAPNWERVNAGTALIKSVMMHKPNQKPGLTFKTLIFSPDPGNLRRLLYHFMMQKYDRWNQMERDEALRVNHPIVCSDEESRSTLEGWGGLEPARKTLQREATTPQTSSIDLAQFVLSGSTALEYKEWYSPAQFKALTDFQKRGATLAFFINRKLEKPDLPEAVIKRAYGQDFGDTTTLVSKEEQSDGTQAVIFSAPNKKMMEGLAAVYPNLDKIPANPVQNEAIDLSKVRVAGLEMRSTLLNDNLMAEIRSRAVSHIRNALNISIADNTAEQRYQIVAQVTQYDGASDFQSTRTRITPDLTLEFAKPEPKRNEYASGADGSQQFTDEHNAWLQERTEHYYHYQNDRCEWHLQVDKQETVKVSVDLRLMDQQKTGGAPLWEDQVSYLFQSDPVGVNHSDPVMTGHAQSPEALPAPPREDHCTDRTGADAVVESLKLAFAHLQSSCRLPEELAPEDTPRAIVLQQAYLARVQDQDLSIHLAEGDREKLAPGPDGKPAHPMMARILKVDVLEGETRKIEIGRAPVTQVFEKSADCMLNAEKDKALLEAVNKLMHEQPPSRPLVEFVAAEPPHKPAARSIKVAPKSKPASKRTGKKRHS